MKIAIAQMQSYAGDIDCNLKKHVRFIELASAAKCDLVVFPELSLTGYEPALANKFASDKNDRVFDVLQKLSDQNNLIVAVGWPLKTDGGILIGMVILKPFASREAYAKQQLHADELPYFIGGKKDLFLDVGGLKVAPAICYESLLPQHAAKAAANGAKLYMASVAKSQRGVEKANLHYPEMALRYSMPVVMANSVGPSDNFVGAGRSAVWNARGVLLRAMGEGSEGALLFDTETSEVTETSTV